PKQLIIIILTIYRSVMKGNKKTYIALVVCVLLLSSCEGKSDDERAAAMVSDIEQAVSKGDFRSALDSIVVLRSRYPKAVNARRRALELWQDASLLEAEAEAAKTDSLLKETIVAIDSAPTLLEQNKLRNRRDSLQARYDAAIGLTKVIREKNAGN
ncbi:MAG: hypothetical protein LUC22_07210, partial [Prevotella sp.]|nr:hypothetical protein [Prevotella sp.]